MGSNPDYIRSERIRFWSVGLMFSFLILPFLSDAQLPDTGWIDVSAIRFKKNIKDECAIGLTSKKPISLQTLKELSYQYTLSRNFHRSIPLEVIENTLVVRLKLVNNSDTTIALYFTPGYYVRNLALYASSNDSLENSMQLISAIPDKNPTYSGSKLVRLAPGEKRIYYASFNFIRTNANIFNPTLIEIDYLSSWLKDLKYRDPVIDISTYIISGILFLMIFYSLAVYIQNRNLEFLYYAIYALCSTLLFFFKSYSLTESKEWNFFYEEYLDFIILGLGVYFYLIFVRRFINTRDNHPPLDKFLRIANWILVALLLIFSLVFFFSNKYVLLFTLENLVIKIFMFLIGGVFIYYSFIRKDKLLNYLAAGNFALLFFSIFSLLRLFGIRLSSDNSSVLNKGLLFYEVGVVLELIFFLSGLAYKNRRDLTERVRERERFKLENERKEFEKQIAIVTTRQEERDRISADMHDELGSGMTAIRLMSEIVKTKMKDQAFPELEKISNSANDLLGKMNSIIWTMKSSNDSLESLVAYIRANALEYFDSTPIACHVMVPDIIPAVEMNGEKRRNIFLSVKESLNNIMKHSHATDVSISITTSNKKLIITVSDNGVGIDIEKLRRFGNGLSNMKRRMENIGGDFKVENKDGSIITFTSSFS